MAQPRFSSPKNPYLWPSLLTQTCLHTDAAGFCGGASGQAGGGLESSDLSSSGRQEPGRPLRLGAPRTFSLPTSTGRLRGGARSALPSLLLRSLAHLPSFNVPPTFFFSPQIIPLCGKPGLKISPAWKNSNGEARGGGRLVEGYLGKGVKERVERRI